jgi:AbrB family looped-hinge helix DNA binding protein
MKEEVVKVSSKGQVVLPADVRTELRISKGQRMVITVHRGVILMKPIKKLSEMRGILKISRKETRKIIDDLRREWDLELS